MYLKRLDGDRIFFNLLSQTCYVNRKLRSKRESTFTEKTDGFSPAIRPPLDSCNLVRTHWKIYCYGYACNRKNKHIAVTVKVLYLSLNDKNKLVSSCMVQC